MDQLSAQTTSHVPDIISTEHISNEKRLIDAPKCEKKTQVNDSSRDDDYTQPNQNVSNSFLPETRGLLLDLFCNVKHTSITPCNGDTIFMIGEVGVTPAPDSIATAPTAVVKAGNAPPGTEPTDISLALIPLGTGALLADQPDGTAVGGNPRGTNAIDWQMSRLNATQVASGNWSTIAGGRENTASGFNSAIGGGQNNTASGFFSTIGGGNSNAVSGNSSAIGGGQSNIASGSNSTVGGGNINIASGDSSAISGGSNNTASGFFSTIPGGVGNEAAGDTSFAAGRFASATDDFGFVWNTGLTDTNNATTNAERQVIYNLEDAAFIPAPANPGTFYINGDLRVTGDIFGASKNFVIPHPVLPGKTLQHSCIEGPTADLLYCGTIQLENGQAQINVDQTAGMAPGTFAALAERPQLFLTNNSTWDGVKILNKSELFTGIFTILSNNSSSQAEIDWMVVAKRKDINQNIELSS